MIATKTVKIEQNIDAVLVEMKNMIIALKQGKSVGEVALQELLRLQTVVQAASGIPGDLKESLPAAIRTVLLGAEDIAMVLLDAVEPI